MVLCVLASGTFCVTSVAARPDPKARLARTMRRLNEEAQARVRKNRHMRH